MARKAVVFEAMREGCSIDQIDNPMTVGELIELLSEFDEDDLFILSHNRGYAYGSLKSYDMEEQYEDEDGEWISADC